MPAAFAPGIIPERLRQRAQVLAQLRQFMAERGVLEAEVPCLGRTGVTDVHIEPLTTGVGADLRYLQTSPEFYLKRLLAAGSGPVYALGPAFRAEVHGRQHRCEFTLLEWYQLGLDHRQLSAEVAALVQRLAPDTAVHSVSYAEAFEAALGFDPHEATAAQLAAAATERLDFNTPLDSPSDYLDLLFSHCVQPGLLEPTLVLDYPVCQAALARLGTDGAGHAVAHRFELYWAGLELANGYFELRDAAEQRRRFTADNAERRRRGLPERPVDEALLAALEAGLPECSGVALGVDRLLMALWQEPDIARVRAFAES